MKTSHTLIGILVSLILGGAMLWVGSQGSLTHNGLALFALCKANGAAERKERDAIMY